MALLLSPLLSTTLKAAGLDSTTLIASLAKPLPAQTTYFEQRESPLLAEPLQFSGVLERPAAGTLVKSVEQPYVERTVIADGRVSIEREGQPKRRFSLKRAPELVALTSSFEAILSGDAGQLQQHYRIETNGNAQAWTLTLSPREPRLAKRVLAIRLYGGLFAKQTNLRCIDLDLAGGENSRMWIGDLAATALATTDAVERAALCAAPEFAPPSAP
ncbi:MAG: LolA-related protein [Pseudomarimonas sp.]